MPSASGISRFQSLQSAAALVGLLAVVLVGLNVQRAPAQSEEEPTPVTTRPDAEPKTTLLPGMTARDPMKGIPEDPIGILFALGWFVYPLGLTSIVAAWVAIERIVVLRRGRVIPRHFVRRFFDLLEDGKLDPKSALKLCDENGSPIAAVLAHGIRKWGRPSVEVEQAVIDGGERQASQLRASLRVLNGAATVSPLLGLLGTVWGMVESFNTIALKATAMGSSRELAGGVSLAMLNTAAGLLIAIPSLVMYLYLGGRADALVLEMDTIGQELVDFISAEGIAEQQRANRAALDRPVPKPADARRAV